MAIFYLKNKNKKGHLELSDVTIYLNKTGLEHPKL